MHARPHMAPFYQLRRGEFRQPMATTISCVTISLGGHVTFTLNVWLHFSKGKMENLLGIIFHDVFGYEKLFMLDDFNENFLDLVEVS